MLLKQPLAIIKKEKNTANIQFFNSYTIQKTRLLWEHFLLRELSSDFTLDFNCHRIPGSPKCNRPSSLLPLSRQMSAQFNLITNGLFRLQLVSFATDEVPRGHVSSRQQTAGYNFSIEVTHFPNPNRLYSRNLPQLTEKSIRVWSPVSNKQI